MEFRLLNANEIDCRVQQITEKGLSLLLYKDARVDQNILDTSVGAMNWQRRHTRDNANCIVSIWDADKKMWIEKEDTGTESNTEKEKGLASDSFKRACFNWGIGRELYSAPRIWISKSDADIKSSGTRLYCYDRFEVAEIGYDENREINKLVIRNVTKKKTVFSFGKSTSPAPDKITQAQLNTIRSEQERTGVKDEQILSMESVNATKLEDLTVQEFVLIMNKFKCTKNKE